MFKCVLALMLFAVPIGCGYEPPKTVAPAGDDPDYAKVKAVVDAQCATCHNGSVHPLRLDTGAALKRSNSKARVADGTMPPPPAKLKAADKGKLLDYLGG